MITNYANYFNCILYCVLFIDMFFLQTTLNRAFEIVMGILNEGMRIMFTGRVILPNYYLKDEQLYVSVLPQHCLHTY